ncbi:thiamine phosphate synthase [Alcaligenaceae bacterium CGII-47]|nr:thiamine phosphate synthase [Alcaligenaceae bacterium CGII-47]
MSLRFPRGLYGITPDWADTDKLLAAIEAAHEGGMVALQWRRKQGERADHLAQLDRVHTLSQRLGLLLIINDDWRLAADINADGVHMGRTDGSIVQARLALGSDKIIGCSCYNDLELAARMLRDDVDYIAFGALYPSRVKPDATRTTLDQIRLGHALTLNHHPRAAVVVIGGLTPDNAAPAIDAGADSIAVISALFEATDIRHAARRCALLFT